MGGAEHVVLGRFEIAPGAAVGFQDLGIVLGEPGGEDQDADVVQQSRGEELVGPLQPQADAPPEQVAE